MRILTKVLAVASFLSMVFPLGLPTYLFSQQRDLRAERVVVDDDNGNTILIQAPATGMTGSWTFTLPATPPSGSGEVLTSGAGGSFSWQTPSGGGGSIPAGYLILGTTSTVPSGFSAAGTIKSDFWTTRGAMTTARRGAASAVVNNKIYVIGGGDGNTALATNQEYDPVTNSWSGKTAMTGARVWVTAAVVNNRIYVFGGSAAAGNYNTAVATNQEYDPATNTWANKAAMPTARMLARAAAVNNKIYVMGGWTGAADVSTNDEYDPATNTWAGKTAMPSI
ncbi:MAG: hypothetical protein H6616_17790, partial [Ignavibacteria bacterium]|nr:hypothetical protein [Ignavibacteria bacterium]